MWQRRLYRWLTDAEGEERSCAAISDEACREAPRSFTLNAANGACTKLAEQLASPGLVLAWLLDAIGAPVAMTGWLEPLRQGGSLLPQLAVSAQIRSRPIRKLFWTAAGLTQAVALTAMAAAALGFQGAAAGYAVLAALAIFSLASGVGLSGTAAALLALGLGRIVGAGIPALAYMPVLFVAGLAIAGVRLGRKTWLVDFADPAQRPLFVAMSNTSMGTLTFAFGGLGLVADRWGVQSVIVILAGLGIVGAVVSFTLPEAGESTVA
jgi:hypothetical protein